jgi:hypothetical protein
MHDGVCQTTVIRTDGGDSDMHEIGGEPLRVKIFSGARQEMNQTVKPLEM